MIDQEEINRRFVYHTPNNEQTALYRIIRAHTLAFAEFLAANVPSSRELSQSLTHLEQCQFYANAAIARRWPAETEDEPVVDVDPLV